MPNLNPLPQSLPEPSGKIPQFADPPMRDLSPTRLRPPGSNPTTAIVPYRPPAIAPPVTRINPTPILRRAAPRAAWRLAPRLARGALGPLGALLLAADLMELLAPAFREWLEQQGPNSGTQPVGAPPFTGGQGECVIYDVRILYEDRTFSNPPWRPDSTTVRVRGPVGGVGQPRQVSPSNWKIPLFAVPNSGGPDGPPCGSVEELLIQIDGEGRNASIGSITRASGLPDTTGNPPGAPVNYPVKQREPRYVGFPIPVGPAGIPGYRIPPSGGNGTSPGIGESRDPKTPLIVIPGGNPFRPPIDPETGEEEDPGPIVKRPNTLPVPVPGPGSDYDEPPRQPPKKPSEEDCFDPCNDAIFDWFDYLKDALEKDKAKPAPRRYRNELLYTVCNENDPEFRRFVFETDYPIPPEIPDLFANSALLAARACGECTPVAAEPVGWNESHGPERPQLVLVFNTREKKPTYHKLVVPHPIITTPPDGPLIESYQKGSTLARVRLNDNSKIQLYASGEAEARRVAILMRSFVDPSRLPPADNIAITKMSNWRINDEPLDAYAIIYYSRGRDNKYPDWYLRLKPYPRLVAGVT